MSAAAAAPVAPPAETVEPATRAAESEAHPADILTSATPFGDLEHDDAAPSPFGAPVAPVQPSAPVAPAAQPLAAQPAGDRPALEALPIKGRGDGPAPGVIPIAKKPAPGASPPPATAPTVKPGPAAPTVQPAAPAPVVSQPAPIAPAPSSPFGGVENEPAPPPALAPAQPSPATPPHLATGGRTWYCRFCGMQSQSADKCDWCHKDLKALPPSSGRPIHVVGPKVHGPKHGGGGGTALAPPGPKSAPGGGKSVRTELRQGNGSGGGAAVAAPPSPNGAGRPVMGTFQAGKSKYYADKVFDPVSQSHYDADTGTAEQTLPDVAIITEETSDIKQLGIFAAVYGVILIAVGVVGHFVPQSYLITLGVATFLAGMLLPVFRVVPFMADDSTDLPYFLALTLIFGPFVGAMFYGVLWIIRGEANPAVVGIFLSYLLARVSLDLTTGRQIMDLFTRMLPELNMTSVLTNWMPLAGLLGWLAADPFKKPDE